MLRLVRYMARLGFEPADEVDPDLLDTVTPDRSGHEVLRMLIEPPRVWRDLEYGGLAQQAVRPRLRTEGDAGREPGRVSDARARLDALKFPAKEREVIVAAARLHDQLDVSDADLWRRLRRERPESIRMAADGGERGAQRFLERDWKLEITGDDLVRAGLSGAQVGDGLEKAMVAMINGQAPDRAAQLRAALA